MPCLAPRSSRHSSSSHGAPIEIAVAVAVAVVGETGGEEAEEEGEEELAERGAPTRARARARARANPEPEQEPGQEKISAGRIVSPEALEEPIAVSVPSGEERTTRDPR